MHCTSAHMNTSNKPTLRNKTILQQYSWDIPVFALLILDGYFWISVFAIKHCQYLEIQPRYVVG